MGLSEVEVKGDALYTVYMVFVCSSLAVTLRLSLTYRIEVPHLIYLPWTRRYPYYSFYKPHGMDYLLTIFIT